MTDHDGLSYRPAAGIMLINRSGQAFAAQRLDTTMENWQMPQGGIDSGEDARAAAIRELGEEIGVGPEHIEFVAEAAEDLFYDLPDELIGKVWKGRYRGQRQRWFLYRFTGEDTDINLATEHPEFLTWRWVDPHELPKLIVPFKRALYEQVLAAFAEHLSG